MSTGMKIDVTAELLDIFTRSRKDAFPSGTQKCQLYLPPSMVCHRTPGETHTVTEIPPSLFFLLVESNLFSILVESSMSVINI